MTFTENDTICAISTPHGRGGIAVIRVSGPEAFQIADTLWRGKPLANATSHTAHLGSLLDIRGEILDQALATVFRAPASFTGEDVVEFSVHGSPYIQTELITALTAAGARLALPGEFTRRAFLNAKVDLAQAEAVADIIAADSRAAHRIAASQIKGQFSNRLNELRARLVDLAALLELELDFSEEHVEFASRPHLHDLTSDIYNEVTRLHDSFAAGQAIKDGIPVAIIGPTNAGKSSLLNALTGDDRAIVSDIHGTTRDTIEETITLGDYLFRIIDTAGLRHTSDTIEQIGIDRSLKAIQRARIIIAVTDITQPIDQTALAPALSVLHQKPSPGYLIIALNKTDLSHNENILKETAALNLPEGQHTAIIPISASTQKGLENLRDTLVKMADNDNIGSQTEGIIVTNARHAMALKQAAESAKRVLEGLENELPGDLIAIDLRDTISNLATITGDIPSQEILNTIFSRFCIGK